jgi:hypothetical protein
VGVVEDKDGWVFSEHDFVSPVDAGNAAKMRNGGVKQIAYALTTESLRREAFLCLLVEMSARPDALERYRGGDDDYKAEFERHVAGSALATLMGIAQKALPDIAREVLHMAMKQARGPKNPSVG